MSDFIAASIPRIPFSFETTQFFVPSTVARQLNGPLIRARIVAAGFEERGYEESTHRMPPGKTLITCKRYVAGFIVEHITEIADRSCGTLLDDCATAGLDAIGGKIHKR